MRQIFTIGLLGLFLALILVFTLRLLSTGSASDQPMLGQKAPVVTLTTLDRDTARALQTPAAQNRPVLINFWATWCTPCLAEHPLFMELADAGVEISGIAYRDNPERIKAFLARHGDPFTTVYLDPDGEAMLSFGNSGVPETYVVSPDGVILAHVRGPIGPEQLRETILPALTGKS